jgi:hypothetical protein
MCAQQQLRRLAVGAGDDEESWAGGLTPTLFWDHHEPLLRSGPHGVEPTAKALLVQQRLQRSSPAAAAVAAAGGGAGNGAAMRSQGSSGRPLRPRRGSSGLSDSPSACGAARGSRLQGVQRDRHHPAPRGCVSSTASYQEQQQVLPGVFWLGGMSVVVGGLAVGVGARQVWQQVDAVLVCGSVLHPALQQQWAAQQAAAAERWVSAPLVGVFSRSLGKQEVAGGCHDKHNMRLSSSFGGGEVQRTGVEGCDGAGALSDQVEELVFSKEEVVSGDDAGQQGVGGQVGRDSMSSCSSRRRSRSCSPVRKGGMLSELLKCPGARTTGACEAAAAVRSGRTCVESTHAGCSSWGGSVGQGGLADGEELLRGSSLKRQGFCDRLRDGAEGLGGSGRERGAAQQRLLWLSVQSSKVARGSLKQHLQAALEFLSDHLSAGHRVLITDMEGEQGGRHVCEMGDGKEGVGPATVHFIGRVQSRFRSITLHLQSCY